MPYLSIFVYKYMKWTLSIDRTKQSIQPSEIDVIILC